VGSKSSRINESCWSLYEFMSFSSEMCIGVGVAQIGSYLFPGKHV
jgi:hypothetical protein